MPDGFSKPAKLTKDLKRIVLIGMKNLGQWILMTERGKDTELIKELEAKRNKLNKLAEKYKSSRDKLNQETKRWAETRDGLNKKVKQLLKSASDHKQKRDDINNQVKEAKKLREKLNKDHNKLQDQMNKIKREKLPKDQIPLGKLKGELKKLEFKQMTSVLSQDKEREMVDLVSGIRRKIEDREKAYEKNEEVQELLVQVKEAKDNAEDQHRLVGTLADEAQQEHDSMVSLYEQSDKVKKEADAAQEKFIEHKLAADEEHKMHITLIRQVHDFDKIISGLKQKERKAKKSKKEVVAKSEAEDIYERFKAGEKLSTEDLMSLQKAGYI
jgi:uncharacterized coiled-coil DUF342 family protein